MEEKKTLTKKSRRERGFDAKNEKMVHIIGIIIISRSSKAKPCAEERTERVHTRG